MSSACDVTVPSNMRQSVESSRNRNNLRQRRQDDGGKKTQTNHVWLCSNICSLDKPSHRGLGAHSRAGINFCSATSCTFPLHLGFRLAGTFFVKNVPAKLHPRLSDAIATRLFCNRLLCVEQICWVQSGPKSTRTLFYILLGQRLGVLALEQCLHRDELQWVSETFANRSRTNGGSSRSTNQPLRNWINKLANNSSRSSGKRCFKLNSMMYTQPHGQRVPTKSAVNSCVATTVDSLGWSENEFQTSSEAEPQVGRSTATVTERWSIQTSVPFRGRNNWVMAGTSASRVERV